MFDGFGLLDGRTIEEGRLQNGRNGRRGGYTKPFSPFVIKWNSEEWVSDKLNQLPATFLL